MATCKVEGFDKNKSFEDQYGWINKETGEITINEPRILETLTHNVDPYARQIAAMTPLHELTHREINTKKIFIGTTEEKRLVNLAAQGLLAEVSTYDEFLTTYTELMAMTGINPKKFTNLSGMRQVLDNVFSKLGKEQWGKIVNPFNTTNLIKSFLANFLDRVATYKDIAAGDEDKDEVKEQEQTIQSEVTRGMKEAGFQFSEAVEDTLPADMIIEARQLGDQINEAVTQALADRLGKPIEELTKADWMREGLADAYMYLIDEQGPGRDLLDNTIRQALRKGKKFVDDQGNLKFGKNITGDNVYGKPMENFLEDVGQQLYRRTIQRFDPSQNTDFGGFTVAELVNFRIGEVLGEYRRQTAAGQTGSMETRLGDTADISLADRIESTEMTPEEYTDQQLALERERKAVTVRQKGKAKKELPKRSAVRQDLSTLKTIDNDIKNQVREELPGVIEEVLKDNKDIKNVDQLVDKIGKKLGERIIKKLGGTIGMKKGEFNVPKQWLDFVRNEYAKLSKGIPGRLIKKAIKIYII